MNVPSRPLSQHIASVAATLALAGGLVTLCGWTFDVPAFIDWFSLGVTMKANPAIATILVAAALLLILWWPARARVASAMAITAMLIGAATLLQHLTGWSFGIDTLLFSEPPGQPATAAPGRMGPPASTSFMLLGAALLLNARGCKRFAVSCALVVLALAMLSLVGYWYGAEAMYAMPKLTGISLQMTLILLALSVGLIASISETGPTKLLSSGDDAGAIAWVLFPAALLIPVVTGFARLQGQRLEWYDHAFGSALRTLVEMALLCALTWWAIRAIQLRDLQRHAAERERESSERRFRSVLESSAVPFAILAPVRDQHGEVRDFEWTYLNPMAARALGFDAGELIGKKVNDAPGTWSEPGLLARYVAVLRDRRIEEFELHSTFNGVEGWFQVVASPLDQQVAVWFSDVSVRKHQELELLRADRRKDEFLATLAHELRNPLAPIRQASLLARKQGLDDAQRQWCNEVIERQVQQMSLLLDDLLDVSRITRGMLQLRRAPTSIRSVVQSAVETVRPLIDSKKHSFEIAMPEKDERVNVDALRLAQVIANLLSNAAKYTDPGGAIRLEVISEDKTLHVRVTDNGIGVAPEHVAHIFRMFGQVKGEHERSEGGLGIGLALTRGLVELHGGTVEVQSAGRDRGSTFHVVLPGVVLDEAALEASSARQPAVTASRRILVADDNVDAAESLAMLLGTDGHDVRVAHDGQEALRIARDFHPEVALLDIGMPGMTGHEVAKAIRASAAGRNVLLVAITGWGQKSDRDLSAAAGFDHHLTKPVEYGDLLRILQQRRVPRESARSA